MFTALAPYAGFGMKLVFGNLWLFGPLLKAVMPSLSAQAGAMLKTTIAFTVQKGSDAYNVLPPGGLCGCQHAFYSPSGREKRAWRSSKKWQANTVWRPKCCMPMIIRRLWIFTEKAFHLVEQTRKIFSGSFFQAWGKKARTVMSTSLSVRSCIHLGTGDLWTGSR